MRWKLKAALRRRIKPDRLRKILGGVIAMVGLVLLSADPTTGSFKAYIMTELAAIVMIIIGVTLAEAWIC